MARAKDANLQSMIVALKSEFQPVQMFIVGENDPATCDFVLVLADENQDRLSNMIRARELLDAEFGIAADVYVYTQTEFDHWKVEQGSVPGFALNSGKEIDLT